MRLGVSVLYSKTGRRVSLQCLYSSERLSGEMAFTMLERPVDVEMQARFRAFFAFDDKEMLLGCEFP